MTVKISGAEYKRFMAADWGPDPVWEDAVVCVNHIEIDDGFDDNLVNDNDTVTITGGIIIPDQNDFYSKQISAETFARKWLKEQTSVVLFIEIEREKETDFLALMKEHFHSAKKL